MSNIMFTSNYRRLEAQLKTIQLEEQLEKERLRAEKVTLVI